MHSFENSFPLWFITGYGLRFPVPCSQTLLFIPSMYNGLHLLIPDSLCWNPAAEQGSSLTPPTCKVHWRRCQHYIPGIPLQAKGFQLTSRIWTRFPSLGRQRRHHQVHANLPGSVAFLGGVHNNDWSSLISTCHQMSLSSWTGIGWMC